jgi:hypothetical protein
MPDLKKNFLQGKMNKDLDERLLPDGQYRDAVNIEVISSESSNVGAIENIKGNFRIESIIPEGSKCIGVASDEGSNKFYWFVTHENFDGIVEYNASAENPEAQWVLVDANKNVLEFPRRTITGINVFGGNIYFTDGFREPKRINILNAKLGTLDHTQHTQLISNGISLGDIKEENITVIRKKPNIAPKFTINEGLLEGESSLFDKTFFRLAFRYKYSDGQYSAIGPFTQVIFNANFQNEINLNNYFSSKEGYNQAMVNSIKSIDVFDFVPDNIPEDVDQVDILYKQEDSTVVYVLANVERTDSEWNAEGLQPIYEFTGLGTVYKPHKGKYTIVSENVKGALPADQLIRPWDNVPRSALAQEISGNRLVYANYKQGYDLTLPPKVYASYESRVGDLDYSNGGIESIKSQRDYQIGVVFSDKYGRETPVITNEQGAVRVPWRGDSDQGSISTSPISFSAYLENTPSWAEYCKFFVKQTSGEYYNLSMYKAYSPNSYVGFENKDDTAWISFSSADRNKIKEDDYIILKSSDVSGQPEAVYDQNKYRVLDIKNEAPDAIKYTFYEIGNCTQDFDVLFSNTAFSVANTTSTIEIDRNTWLSGTGYTNTEIINVDVSGSGDVDSISLSRLDVYISWTNVSTSTSESSSRYKVVSAKYSGGKYTLKLEKQISETDANLASSTGLYFQESEDTGATTPTVNESLIFKVEERKISVDEDFSGKFFVQLASDDTFNKYLYYNVFDSVNTLLYKEVETSLFWHVDRNAVFSGNNYTSGNLFNVEDNGEGFNNPADVNNESAAGYGITDTQAKWSNLPQKSFFVDGLYVAGAQTSNTKYAKYSKQGWVGEFEGDQNGVRYNYPVWNRNDGGFEEGSWINDYYYPTPDTDRIFNGLEPFVTTNNSHVNGSKQWTGLSYITSNGLAKNDLKSFYGDETGKHYIHVSFLAPGKDLHDGSINFSNLITDDNQGIELADVTLSRQMQGIFGGGAITPKPDYSSTVFPGGIRHIAFEWSDDLISGKWTPPGHNVPNTFGYGYSSVGKQEEYLELHERQWDCTYGVTSEQADSINSFLLKLNINSKIKFQGDSEVYTILNKKSVKLYNHTPWRARKKWNGTEWVWAGDSVEEAAHEWGTDRTNATKQTNLKNKIQQFGSANNRRLCFILELDKKPTVSNTNIFTGNDGDIDSSTSKNFSIVSPFPQASTGTDTGVSAIWETEPRQLPELNIYFEASDDIPLKIRENNRSTFAPLQSTVSFPDFPDATKGTEDTQKLLYWRQDSNNPYTYINITPGVNLNDDSGEEIQYGGRKIRFTRDDGTYVTADILGQDTNPNYSEYALGLQRRFIINQKISDNSPIGLNWFNCFSFENGVESNRIRDDFNATQITNGAKASTTTDEPYKEEVLTNSLIYSGIYNQNSKVNNLNQFIQAQNITKDINPTYGSIQKLFSRSTDLVSFCEDRVVKILANKDAVFNADGNPQLTASENVLGQAVPFVGDYGISTNPESFASDSYRAYFADKARGAVLRLSMDGITPISDIGMKDWFRDNLPKNQALLGTYDQYTGVYNLTLKERVEENLIQNSEFDEDGVGISNLTSDPVERVLNGNNIVGTNYNNNLVQQNFLSADGNNEYNNLNLIYNNRLDSVVVVTNWPEIPQGYFQQYVAPIEGDPGTEVLEDVYTVTQEAIAETDATFNTSSDWSNGTVIYEWNTTSASNNTASNPTVSTNNGTGDLWAADWSVAAGATTGITSTVDFSYTTWDNSSYSPGFSGWSPYVSEAGQMRPYMNIPVSYASGTISGIPNAAVSPQVLNNTTPQGTSYPAATNMTIFETEVVKITIKFKASANYANDNTLTGYLRFYMNLIGANGSGSGMGDYVMDVDNMGSTLSGITGENQNSIQTSTTGVFRNYGFTSSSTIMPSASISGAADNTEREFITYIMFKDPNKSSSDYTANYVNNNISTEPILTKFGVRPQWFVNPDADLDDDAAPSGWGVDDLEVWLTSIKFEKVRSLVDPGGPAIAEEGITTQQGTGEFVGVVDAVPEVPAVPSTTIPAWSEVYYKDNTGWTLDDSSGVVAPWINPSFGAPNPGSYVTEHGITYYTGTSNGVTTYQQYNNNNPNGYGLTGTNNSGSGTLPTLQSDLGYTVHAENTDSKIYVDAHKTDGTSTSVYIKQSGYGEFQDGHWYLLDVEYEDIDPGNQPAARGTAGEWNIETGLAFAGGISADVIQTGYGSSDVLNANGDIISTDAVAAGYSSVNDAIISAGGATAYGLSHYNENDPGFVNYPKGTYGLIGGGSATSSTKTYVCKPTITAGAAGGEYYTAGRTVARTIFQYNSAAHSDYGDDQIVLQVYGRRGLINRIDVIDITEQNTSGEFSDFTTPSANYQVPHALTHLITTTSSGTGYQYESPEIYYGGDSVNFYCVPNSCFQENFTLSNGYYFTQSWAIPSNWNPLITAQGYAFKFIVEENPDHSVGIQGAVNAYVTQPNTTGTFYGFGVTNVTEPGFYTVRGNFDNVSNVTVTRVFNGLEMSTTAIANTTEVILNDTTGTTDDGKVTFYPDNASGFVGRINSISLMDATQYFTGNSIDSWSFSGFDQSIFDYIVFDDDLDAITFNDAPTSSVVEGIQVEQVVGQFTNGDTYDISFSHANLTGVIEIYYFNKFGQGFILEIDNGGTGTFSQQVTIGQDEVDLGLGYLADTLVVRSKTGVVNGSIDNMFLQRQLLNYVSKTVSFSETAKGWTSFKSFIPEHGVSVSKKYYTFDKARLYEHNHENALRCNFYEEQYSSNVNFIFNVAPETVKSFRNISYEGTQGKTFVDPGKFSFETDLNGWAVSSLNTDLEKGLVSEFSKKEGKWFGRIQSKDIGDLQYEDFVMQGLGIINSVASSSDDEEFIDE